MKRSHTAPYGTPTIESGTATTNLLYAGQYTDPNSGLIYMRARWYDPASGQFLSVDPDVAQTGAAYAYAGDNPTDNTDPGGQNWLGISWLPSPGQVIHALNPLTYYEDEINAYENGCGYWSSVLYGVQGAVVATTDVAGIGGIASKLADVFGAGAEADQAAYDYATEPNKLNHIFDPKHVGLNELADELGGAREYRPGDSQRHQG